jgi:hypothetical protein
MRLEAIPMSIPFPTFVNIQKKTTKGISK